MKRRGRDMREWEVERVWERDEDVRGCEIVWVGG